MLEYSVAKRLACRWREALPGINRPCPIIAEKRRLESRCFYVFFFLRLLCHITRRRGVEWMQIADNVESPIRVSAKRISGVASSCLPFIRLV